MLKKKKIHVFNNDYYLLGADNEGTKYYLQKAEFECGWYWSIGYVETFTNNKSPEHSRDINSHQHFDTLFLCKDYRDFIDIEYLTIESGSVMAEILIYACVLSFLILAILKAIKGFKNVN